MPALYALFAIACMFWAPTLDAVVWLVIVIGAKVVLLDQGRRFLAAPPAQVKDPAPAAANVVIRTAPTGK